LPGAFVVVPDTFLDKFLFVKALIYLWLCVCQERSQGLLTAIEGARQQVPQVMLAIKVNAVE